jgi:hypothetical protein
MGKHSKLLKDGDLKSIKKWIKHIKHDQYEYISNDKNDPRDWPNKIKLPYRVIGCGLSRIVYDMHNGYVLKIAITLRGIKSNKMEAKLYNTAPDSLRKYLVEVKDHGYGWLVMKKIVEEVPHKKKSEQKVLSIENKFIKYGINPRDIVSKRGKIRWKNIRLNEKGTIVIIDYGVFKMIS